MKKKSSYENLQGSIRNLKTPAIEVFKNIYEDRDYVIHFDVPECTCICPKTGLPDFLTIQLIYKPGECCIELKSFKLYIVAFRNVGIFHENLVNKILDDVVACVHPKWAKVEGIVNPRGGIQTTVTAEYNGQSKRK